MKLLLIAFVVLVMSLFVNVNGVSAHPGHVSCEIFGKVVADFSKTPGQNGEYVRENVPVNDIVTEEHEDFCTPK